MIQSIGKEIGGSGGNIYLRIIYGDEFESKCGSVHRLGIDDYTIQEKADYTAYLYERQLEIWTNIFGKYGSISSGGNINDLNLYNTDGSVNQTAIEELNSYLRSHQASFGSYRGLDRLQCTWWVAIRADEYLEKFGTKYKEYPTHADSRGTFGNGGVWYDKNKDYGWFEYGSEPRANSIISWKGGQWGHVAYVEAVDYVNQKIYISHANAGVSWTGVTAIPMSGIYDSSQTLNGYIYLDSPK